MSGMAEVLAAHDDWTYLIARNAMVCAGRNCHWSKPLAEDESSREAFRAHQAEALSAAGFGPVKEAASFTERQAAEWPKAVAEVQRYVDTSTVSTDLFGWTVQWADETRPGRGHHFDGTWTDGEYFAQVRMDVYGYASVSVAETIWLHNSSAEECDCEPCAAVRDA